MKPGLIFDLDGTLVDSLPGIAESLNLGLRQHGLAEHSAAAVRGFIGNGSRVLVERASSDPALVDNVERAFKTDYDIRWPEGTIVYPEIADLLSALQSDGYPLAVLSNKPHPFTVAIVSKMFPEIRFAAVLGQRPGIPHKPDPAGALEISESIARAPADCVVIGDSTMDLETARNAGMRSLAVTWGYHDRDRLLEADEIVETPAQLLARFRSSI